MKFREPSFEKEKSIDEDYRKKELQQKFNDGSITPEEKAELQGLNSFPDDPRGAELYKKFILDTITDEENKELIKLFQQGSSNEKNSHYSKFDQFRAEDDETGKQEMANMIKKRVGGHFISDKAFKGGTVLDVGSRDGRFLEIIRQLGAEKVVAIEPNTSELSDVDLDRLKTADELFNDTLEEFEISKEANKYDGAVVLNCPLTANEKTLTRVLSDLMNDDAIAIFSFAERETYDKFMPEIKKHFKDIEISGNLGDKEWGPHKIIIFAKK